MSKYTFHAELDIQVEAEDEHKAAKMAWALMDKRIDAQQIGESIVTDWVLDTTNSQKQAQFEEGDNRRVYQPGEGDEVNGAGNKKGNQGFASMPPEKRREIAKLGGQASHSGGGSSSDKELDAMKELLKNGNLDDNGRKEVQDAINKHNQQLAAQH